MNNPGGTGLVDYIAYWNDFLTFDKRDLMIDAHPQLGT
jgi:hypothetical protein